MGRGYPGMDRRVCGALRGCGGLPVGTPALEDTLMHQCNGLCGLCCLLRPSVDPYRR